MLQYCIPSNCGIVPAQGIASSSFFFLSTCIGIPIEPIVYFVCDAASEWSDGLYFLFGVFLP